ncbi:putative cysteine desulfurase [Caloramator mitchellensis]|uniref:cysteine desulfurase n=1 Tax=Caloramator mitchellensis TaxID=908809 RepID=A0A0R3JS92_CALMK|nr:cysteine desulfurase [Caloramator mitchellensis]KRQ86353.1 putative cysteine desulfurase [Caloramator mitchellensis]
MFNVDKIRDDFPILERHVNNKRLVYLDNAATTQKPESVIKSIKKYYEKFNGNPHRSLHALSALSTEIYDASKEKVRQFINADSVREIIYTKNASEAINLVANSYGLNFIEKGDEIVISIMEHHSNILPWQKVAKAKGAVLKYMYINDEGIIPESEFEKITDKTKFVSIVHVSNVLGTVNPVKKIIEIAHSFDAKVLVDAAQSIPHMKVDVKDLDADFLVFSAHKMLGPMGIGVLYGKENLLDTMPPFLMGGDMIEYVTEQDATFAELPYKFEAGTQNVDGAMGLSAAMDYLNKIGIDSIHEYEERLINYAYDKISVIPHVKIIGPKERSSVISFTVDDVHPHDVATILDSYGIAIRAGHHCAQPLMRYLNLPATSRMSVYFYNTYEEIDYFVESLKNVRKWLGYGA